MRESYREIAHHRKDKYKNIGFDYRGQFFRRTLSKLMFSEQKRANILAEFDKLMVFIIDSIKHIKKARNYNYSKNFRDFN